MLTQGGDILVAWAYDWLVYLQMVALIGSIFSFEYLGLFVVMSALLLVPETRINMKVV